MHQTQDLLETTSQLQAIEDAISSGDSQVQQFYRNAVVFMTGGSGLLGKQLIEKLLRSCKIQKLYLLLRAKRGKSVQERLYDILQDPLYEYLRSKQPDFAEKLFPMEGDVAELRLGLCDDDWKIISDEVDIIMHLAAGVHFGSPLKVATFTNVRGTREILQLGKECKNLRSLVHVSTGYASITVNGMSEIKEEFYQPQVPADVMIKLAETLDDTRMDAINTELIKPWPNNYTFTKLIAEDAIRNAKDLPICIVRPTIVISTYLEPMPGWLDHNYLRGHAGLSFATQMGINHVFLVNYKNQLDFVPSDYVVNSLIAAGWETGLRAVEEPRIYNITSTNQPFFWGANVKNILCNQNNQTLSPKAMWYSFLIKTESSFIYWLLFWILQFIPGYIMDAICMIMGKKPRYIKFYSRIYKLTYLLEYYINNEWVWRDMNTQMLLSHLSSTDKVIFNFDIREIDWKKLFDRFVLGMRIFINKDNLKGNKYTKRVQFFYRIATYMLFALYFYCIWKFFGYVIYMLRYLIQ